MNARQRRTAHRRNYRLWPLGAEVAVLTQFEVPHRFVCARGYVSAHPDGCRTCCEVTIPDQPSTIGQTLMINFRQLRLIDKRLRGQRPWFKQRPWSNGTP